MNVTVNGQVFNHFPTLDGADSPREKRSDFFPRIEMPVIGRYELLRGCASDNSNRGCHQTAPASDCFWVTAARSLRQVQRAGKKRMSSQSRMLGPSWNRKRTKPRALSTAEW